MERVNKVSVLLEENSARISLYRTNCKLAEISNSSLNIPSFEDSGMPNKTLYSNYCRDLMINLLENNGVEGYYYEAKQSTESQKYDKSSFNYSAKQMLIEILDTMQVDYRILNDTKTDITEKYKDSYVKDARADFNVEIGENLILVPINIKSGQMCKPKIFLVGEEEYSLNITNVNKILKGVL